MGVLIMTNYLAIIRKLDFVDLFKYGYFLLNHAVSFDGDVIAHKDDENLFKQVTSKMNLYEYSFEYLMIHFTSDKDVSFLLMYATSRDYILLMRKPREKWKSHLIYVYNYTFRLGLKNLRSCMSRFKSSKVCVE